MVERFESLGEARQPAAAHVDVLVGRYAADHRLAPKGCRSVPRRVGARRLRSADRREGGLALPIFDPTAGVGCWVVEPVFISSLARDGMGAIRASAKAAVESLQMRPVMFETAPASRDDSRRALLDELGGCDVVVLLLGAGYGERTERGVSATEDEFNEAVRRGIPVVGAGAGGREVSRAGRVREPGARDVERQPRLSSDLGDVGFAVVRALNAWRQRGATNENQMQRWRRSRARVGGRGGPGRATRVRRRAS